MAELTGRAMKPIGEYQPLVTLGQGGMGAAYLARAIGIGGFERLVVVKRLHAHLLNQPDARRRFLDEARLAGCVHHANVVGIHQTGSDDEGHFLVLDYVEGGSVDDLVNGASERGGTIPIPILFRIAVDALSGLQAVHDARGPDGKRLDMLHRDVSPHNILVGRDGLSRIADFGIAKSKAGQVSTDKAYIVGKLLYMSPEYLRRQSVGPTMDVYAMGVTLWVALAGAEPWQDVDDAQLVARIMTEGVPRLSTAAQAPPQVEAIVSRACATNPAERYRTAREMAEAIEAVSRSAGWIASHAEVAEYVEDLLGGVLAERRNRLIAEIDRLSREPRLSFEAAPNGLAEDAGQGVAAPTGSLAFSASKERRTTTRWVVPVSIVAGAFSLIGGFVALRGGAREASVPSAAATPASPVAPVAPATTETEPAARAAPKTEASAPSEVSPPPPARTTPRKAKAVAVPRRPEPARGETAPAPPPAEQRQPATPRPSPPPDGIIKRNPYR